jgi:SAM-dependent methyltransferase
VAPEFAKRVSKDCKLELETTDVGLWHEQYAILFRPHLRGTHFDIAMIPRGDSRFEDCGKYWRSLHDKAKEIHFPPELVDPDLADRWEEYVNPSERERHLHPFLAEHLAPFKSEPILDAAAGIGCEVVFLKRNGFRVRGNELEPKFRVAASNYARRHGQRDLSLDGHNWLDFALQYQAYEFGAILLLGNSICLLLKEEERRRALNQMSQILRPGGVLIVDERNFPAMLQNRSEVLGSPDMRQFGNVMYCGTSIRGYPLEITDEKVTWACYASHQDVLNDLGDINKNSVGEFELHPFGENELPKLLRASAAGAFEEVITFSDLKEGYRPGAEFYTHIARKAVA